MIFKRLLVIFHIFLDLKDKNEELDEIIIAFDFIKEI